MKTISLVLCSFLAFLTIVDRNPFIQTVHATVKLPWYVYDTDGDAVRAGVQYYLIQVPYYGGGAITLGRSFGHESCPAGVLLGSESQGIPVTISPATGRKGLIRYETDVNIMFTRPSECGNSTVWKVGDVDSSSGLRYVTIGGVKGNPGPDTLNSWFRIEASTDFYGLNYCPTVCPGCKVDCSDVGFYTDYNGITHAALNGVPFRIRFQKA